MSVLLSHPELQQRILDRSIPEPNSGCWLWLGAISVKGYGRLCWRGLVIRAHRASSAAFDGDLPDDFVVRHRCDNPICVNPDHLVRGTQADNCADMYARRRNYDKTGMANPRAKFGVSQILLIHSDPRNQKEIAAHYGVSQSTVSRVKRNEVYKDIVRAGVKSTLPLSFCLERTTTMTNTELQAAAIKLFGDDYRACLPRMLRISYEQSWRYLTGKNPIPGPVAVAIETWLLRGIPKKLKAA